MPVTRASNIPADVSCVCIDEERQKKLDREDPEVSIEELMLGRPKNTELEERWVIEQELNAILSLASNCSDEDKALSNTIYHQSAAITRRKVRLRSDGISKVEVPVPMTDGQYELYEIFLRTHIVQITNYITQRHKALEGELAEFEKVWEACQHEYSKDGNDRYRLGKLAVLMIWNAGKYAPRGKRQQHMGSARRAKYSMKTEFFRGQGHPSSS